MSQKYKIFIDGGEGTTGLKIHERFAGRKDLELLHIDEEKRKDPEERKKLINQSDITFLCLPDAAAREAVSLADNEHTKIIDASTAHRTNPQWAYGFPELSAEHRERIKTSGRVAVPGCYASGFIACVYPLVKAGILPVDYPVTCHGISGYSGAGKKMIAVMEGPDKPEECYSPRQYALGQGHKHLPEMQKICGLKYKPMFNPIVDDYYSGMVVSVPLHTRCLAKSCAPEDIRQIMAAHYEGSNFVKVRETGGTETLPDGFLASNTLAGTNMMEIFVCGNEEQVLVASRLDNLGKGASGAAVQCMNIMIGIDETTGLL
ncbi:N-acetyl-gamma-glutamyl-phosphate reductase [Anaerovorax odorimutans]|uniref:N-acetyl-gamma-glutamyl-phosphate reductase n=1 Tax=Anaerovorax odorimutans TaxID=109327 RepID=A0ABT1RIZ9_9FIRM|nr:N-acetyl-gamma-glutamyl-phosphate reductase [Anaerovorax odorimutans]MCQ4635157.1 N-acetyl-gamma-glutamyl-phosphate reductase [Anaerovorax odorimutans]